MYSFNILIFGISHEMYVKLARNAAQIIIKRDIVVLMNIIICDDNEAEASRLRKSLVDSGFQANIAIFSNGIDVIDHIHSGAGVDLCFLDIIMPGFNGISLASDLRAEGYNGEIVFLSTSREYGPETYTVRAFSYLLKPFKQDDLCHILDKLEKKQKEGDKAGIFLKMAKVARYVLYNEISHIEVKSHYVYFRLSNGEELEIYATFSLIAEQLLMDRRFAQCHRSYIVNMDDIESIGERLITMHGGMAVPYSRSYSEIKKKFTKWIAEGIK